MKPKDSRRFQFGGFTLDRNSRTLRDERGSQIEISAQAFDALAYLLINAGRLVERAELMSVLWPHSVVEDNTLSRVVVLLRRTLGDGHIVTVKGRGYQFVADVRVVTANPVPDSMIPATSASAGLGRRAAEYHSAWYAAGVGLAATVLAILIMVFGSPPDHTPDAFTRYADVPTENERALQFYLSARTYEIVLGEPELAVRQYQRAVEEDPEFALAWARLSIAHNERYWFRDDVSDSRRRLAFDAVTRAIALEPELPEARMALGWYYYHIESDYPAALSELERAADAIPGDPEIHWRIGSVHRRMGNVDLALAKYEHAATLEPVDGGLLEVAESKLLLRNYAEAEEVFDRILELAPNHSPSLAYKAAIPLYRDGDVRELRRAADEGGFSHENPWTTPGPIMGWTASIYEKRFEDALAFLGAWDASAWPHQGYASKDGLYALTYELAGRPAEAAAHWQRALAHIEGVLDQNAQYPEAWMAHAEALARLGSPDAAITEAYRVIDHYERAGDELYGAERRLDAVRRVFVPVGAFVDAFMLLDRYLSGNGRWAVESLAKDPRLEPIRDDPLFGDLLKKYGRNEPDHERSR